MDYSYLQNPSLAGIGKSVRNGCVFLTPPLSVETKTFHRKNFSNFNIYYIVRDYFQRNCIENQ